MWHTDTAISMLNVWDRWLRLPFKRQEICERKMCVTVPFTTPYSVNVVWVSCLCVLWEGTRQSNAYRHMQSERNGWLAVMANKHIIHGVDPRDSMDLFAIWVCVQSNVLRLLLFTGLLCAIAAHALDSTGLDYCVSTVFVFSRKKTYRHIFF